METKKIFITGIAGFLGSHLADSFIEKGHEVIGCDNLIGGYLDNVPKDAKFYTHDCNNLNLIKKITKDVDIIYHCAALAYEGLSVFSPALISENIYHGTASVLSAAISNNVKRFVFCSSMARYGNIKSPFTEDMIPEPEDPYGIAKYASELLIKRLAKVFDMEYVIAVPHNIIGPRQKYDDPYRNVVSIMINLMLQGRQPIIYGDGNQKRCFSFVNDVLTCLDKMAFQKNIIGETINVGPDEESITINNLAKTIAELLNFDLKPIYMTGSPLEVKIANCSANKARKMLGYKTQYTLERGLQEMIDYIKNRGVKPFKYHLPLEIINEKTPKTWAKKLF